MEPEEENSIEEYFDEKINVMILGDSNVGKSSIITKYCKNEFLPKYIATIGLDFQMKYLNIDKKKVRLQIWDTAGQERYKVVSKNLFNTSDGFIVIYDITDRESFNSVNNWIEQIISYVGKDVKCVIFGNKNDLDNKRKVEINEGNELANKFKFKFFETSAKEGNNLEEGFNSLTFEIMGNIKSVKERRHNSNTSMLKPQNRSKLKNDKKCC